jgi:trigger factor
MQVSVENTSAIGRRVTITVPADRVQLEVVKRTKEVQKNGKIAGFRQGKVPEKMIQEKFGAQIRNEAISNIIETTLPSALIENALEPAGRPEIEEVKNMAEVGKDITYVVCFEIYPEINLPDFKTIQVEKYEVKITEADVDAGIKNLRKQMATWVVVERPAEMGDKLLVDYTSTLNGKPYENNGGKEVSVELGKNVFIEGFESALLGAVTGETRECDLHFPKEWRIEKLAGQPVHFSIHVKEISEQHLVDLDEAFANKIGASGSDLSAIRAKVRENVEKQVAYAIQENVKKDVLSKILTLVDLPLPKVLVETEISALHEDLHRRNGNQAHESCHHNGLEEEAKRRLALSLILQKIIKLEKLTLDNEKVRQKISEIAESFGNAEFIEKMYYESKELLSGIQNSVLVEQAVNLILAQASLIPKPIAVETLFNLA